MTMLLTIMTNVLFTIVTVLLLPIDGSKGGARDAHPSGGPNSFIFMQFLAKKIEK